MKNKLKTILFTIGAIIFGALFLFFLIGTIAVSSDENITGVSALFAILNLTKYSKNSPTSLGGG